MKQYDEATIKIPAAILGDLICSTNRLAAGIGRDVLVDTASRFVDDPDAAHDFFINNYEMIAGAMNLIAAATEILAIAYSDERLVIVPDENQPAADAVANSSKTN